MKQISFKKFSIAASAFVCTAVMSLSIGTAEAGKRVYIYRHYNPYYDVTVAHGLPWYAVRAYYNDGPWSGPAYTYAGWADYAKINGIACIPGTLIKGGDGIAYVCQ